MATRKTKKTEQAEEIREEAQAEMKSIFEQIAERYPVTITELNAAEIWPAKEGLPEVTGMIRVRSRLSLSDMSTLVNLAVDMCTDSKTGEIRWEFYEYVTALLIITMYCGMDAPNAETGYAAVADITDLYAAVVENIDDEQIAEIWDATERKLKAREALNNAAAVGRLNTLLESVQALMDEIGKMAEGFDGEQAIEALGTLNKLATGK